MCGPAATEYEKKVYAQKQNCEGVKSFDALKFCLTALKKGLIHENRARKMDATPGLDTGVARVIGPIRPVGFVVWRYSRSGQA
jgi:hypothetical protein